LLADFTIGIEEARKPLSVRVKVHDNVAALRSAASRHSNRFGTHRKGDPDYSDVLGICHRFHNANEPVCALVRLAPPHVGAGMVAHEMGHAAVWMWEIQNKFKVPLLCNDDEWFCWVLGELVRHTTTKLYEHGIYLEEG
jgi:hypothetical protein